MEQDILEQLYRQYYGAALLYALSLCGSEAQAEDLVADAFVTAFVSLDERHPAFQFWLFRVLKNLWVDQLRRSKRQPEFQPADLPTPEQLVLRDERRRMLWKAMGTLAPADRELVTLHYFSGLPIAQIAQMLGRTPGAVKTRLCRLRQQLKRKMEEQGYEV